MKFLVTPGVIDTICDYIKGAEKKVYISISQHNNGKFLDKIIKVIKDTKKDKNLEVTYIYEAKGTTPLALLKIKHHLREIKNISRLFDFNHLKYFNIDDRYIIIGSTYISDHMYKYKDTMILFDSQIEEDVKYIDLIDPFKFTISDYVYYGVSTPHSIFSDFKQFFERAESKLVIIMPYLTSWSFFDKIISKIFEDISPDVEVTIITPRTTISPFNNMYNKIELNRINKIRKIKTMHTEKHFHHKNIIVDDRDILIGTGNLISHPVYKFYDMNLKFYDKKEIALESYEYILDIMKGANKETVQSWINNLRDQMLL